MNNLILYITVFISGAYVLFIELIGTRILAPFFGTGLYTWSALISVTLAALASGYKFGGQYADKYPNYTFLYSLCALTGVWALSTLTIARMILPVLVQLEELRYAVLLSSFILFFPGLFILGAVCPFTIRLLFRESDKSGSTSGLVFSISTLGSLTGALITGFILIPNIGIQTIFISSGLFMVFFSLLCLLYLRSYKAVIIIAFLSTTSCLYAITSDKQGSITILDKKNSFYGQLHIIQKNELRVMMVDGIGQNYVAENNYYATPYVNFISTVPNMREVILSSPKALVIGLGAGQIPELLDNIGFNVEAVEIDPVIAEMAFKHFSLNIDKKNIHFSDGRVYLQHTPTIYDYIVIDAFTADQLAWHLMTKEAIELTRKRLASDGILAINLTSFKNGNDVGSIKATLQAIYPFVNVYAYSKYSEQSLTSIVFLASNIDSKLEPAPGVLNNNQLDDARYFLNGKIDIVDGGLVLTDNYNPLAYQRESVQAAWRKEMKDFLGEDLLNLLIF